MAKALLVLLIIGAAAFFIYKETATEPTEEDMLVRDIRDRYAVVVNKFTGAAGRSGISNLDSTFDIDTIVEQLQKVRTDLAKLRGTLAEPKAAKKAAELAEKIERFCRMNNILQP